MARIPGRLELAGCGKMEGMGVGEVPRGQLVQALVNFDKNLGTGSYWRVET